MFWKVNYEKDGKKDSLYYGGLVTNNEKKRRNEKLKKYGYKIISCYPVKKI